MLMDSRGNAGLAKAWAETSERTPECEVPTGEDHEESITLRQLLRGTVIGVMGLGVTRTLGACSFNTVDESVPVVSDSGAQATDIVSTAGVPLLDLSNQV